MKPFACKCLFILPIILFVDYLILVTLGSTSSFFGADDAYFCNAYCPISLMIIGASLVFFVWLIVKNGRREECSE